jgi:cyclic pyranopterin phosphate synthase
MAEFTHFDESGACRMVDVGEKPVTRRLARASGQVRMNPATLARIRDRQIGKGDVLEVARLAGIMAAKRTGEWIPLCHTLPLDSLSVDFEFLADDRLGITATACATARTGVEMEALVAVSVACCTVFDMVKSADRAARITEIRVLEKSGGARGDWRADGLQGPEPEDR